MELPGMIEVKGPALLPPCGFGAVYHWPRFYRFRVGLPGWRAMRNRYRGSAGSATIGVAVVAGRYAYCVKWAEAKVTA